MEIFGMLGNASIAALLSLLVSLFPLPAGVAYMIRPTEQRLALLRPISLAGLFAGLGGMVLGFMNVLRMYFINDPPPPVQTLAVGAAEALVSLFVAFGCLTVAWLCVAFGMRRKND